MNEEHVLFSTKIHPIVTVCYFVELSNRSVHVFWFLRDILIVYDISKFAITVIKR